MLKPGTNPLIEGEQGNLAGENSLQEQGKESETSHSDC